MIGAKGESVPPKDASHCCGRMVGKLDQLPKWLRIVLSLVLAVVGAYIWVFIIGAMGSPTILVSVGGAFVIGVGIFVWMNISNSN